MSTAGDEVQALPGSIPQHQISMPLRQLPLRLQQQGRVGRVQALGESHRLSHSWERENVSFNEAYHSQATQKITKTTHWALLGPS